MAVKLLVVDNLKLREGNWQNGLKLFRLFFCCSNLMSIVFYSFATSPFDQFEIITLIPFRLSSFIDLSLTNSAVFLLFALFVAHSLNNNVISNAKLIPTR